MTILGPPFSQHHKIMSDHSEQAIYKPRPAILRPFFPAESKQLPYSNQARIEKWSSKEELAQLGSHMEL